MRHYLTENAALRMARTPLLLAGRVSARTPAAALVAIAGGPHAEAASLLRARSVAVNVPGNERHGYASPCQCVQFYARLIATAAG